MADQTKKLVFEQTLQASPELVTAAFTNATALREWLSDVATVDPKPGGRFYLAWNSGDYTSGAYLRHVPGKEVAFSWLGRADAGPSQVEVTVSGHDDHAHLTLRHMGLGSGEAWEATVASLERSWKEALENLVSVLEVGEDLRFTRRPMLGITLSNTDVDSGSSDETEAKGVQIDGTLEGMGADAAGLRGEDIIVRMAKTPVSNWASLSEALDGYRSGDRVEVVFYRKGERLTVEMELSQRPLPKIPESADDLADAVESSYKQTDAELAAALDGITEAEAAARPGKDDWSPREVLAHLIHGERGNFRWLNELIGGHEPWADTFGDNEQAPVDATLAVYATVADLVEALQRAQAETVALLRVLPDSFVQRRGSYWRVAHNFLQPPFHHRVHIEQIKAARAAEQVPEA